MMLEVLGAQLLLNSLGSELIVDGILGLKTKTSIGAFQARYGLEISLLLDSPTIAVMEMILKDDEE